MDSRLPCCFLVVLLLGAASGRYFSTNELNILEEENGGKAGDSLEVDRHNSVQEIELNSTCGVFKGVAGPCVNLSLNEIDLFCAICAKRMPELGNIMVDDTSAFVEDVDRTFIGSRGKRNAGLEDKVEDDVYVVGPEKYSFSRPMNISEEEELENAIITSAAGEKFCNDCASGIAGLGELYLLWGEVDKSIRARAINDSTFKIKTFYGTRGKRSAESEDKIEDESSPEDANRYIPARRKRNAEFGDVVEADSSPKGTERYIPTYVKRNAKLNNKIEDKFSLEDANKYIPTGRARSLVSQLLEIQSDDNNFAEEGQKISIRTKRIAGGIDANEKEFPYQVSLRFDGLHICGGALISEQHVLTAAHCICGIIDEPYDDLTVVTGSVMIDKGGQSHVVKNVHCHHDFVFGLKQSWQDDIAVVTLNDTVPLGNTQSPAKLPTSDAAVSQKAVITGWGKSKTQGYLHKKLQKLAVNIISNKECQGYYNNPILSSQICSFKGQGSGACKGDSGSPLVSNGTIIGVFSWTKPCALGSPEVFTNVRYFTDFIQRSMKNQDSINPITDHEKIGVNVRVSNGTRDSVRNNTHNLTLIDHGTATVSLV